MSLVAERALKHIGETDRAEGHDLELVQERNKRVGTLRHYDLWMANAGGEPRLQQFWREGKAQDVTKAQRLKPFVDTRCQKDCF